MNFLVILISLTINYLWLKDLDRFDDTWFFNFRRKMEESVGSKTSDDKYSSLAPLLFIYGIPLLVLGLLLLYLRGVAFGLPTMVVHILVLLVAFDRTQPGNLVNCFLERWRRGDLEACTIYLGEELNIPEETESESAEALSEFFKQQLTYRCFEKMFVMFFWYMLTGPMGIMFCYVSYQLRDTQHENHSADEGELVRRIIYLLEWVPLRLLAITFSLAGNFVHCFENLKKSFWEFDPATNAAVRLHGYARCALSGARNNSSEDDELETSSAEQAEIAMQEREIENLQALLERSQAIWLAILALITIFGLQIT